MEATMNFSQTAFDLMKDGFTVELWVSVENGGPNAHVHSLMSISADASGRTAAASCNSDDELLNLEIDNSERSMKFTNMLRVIDNKSVKTCPNTPDATLANTTMHMLILSYDPSVHAMFSAFDFDAGSNYTTLAVENSALISGVGISAKTFAMSYDNAKDLKLVFAKSNMDSGVKITYHSFAIYPWADTDTDAAVEYRTWSKVEALYDAGLPNTRPYVPSFARSIPETGGDVNFCASPLAIDSSCRDAGFVSLNDAVPTERVQMEIVSLPAKGTLYYYDAQGVKHPATVGLALDKSNDVKVFFQPAEAEHSFSCAADGAAGKTQNAQRYPRIHAACTCKYTHAHTHTYTYTPQHTTPIHKHTQACDGLKMTMLSSTTGSAHIIIFCCALV
jgi:uncharacterized protein YcfL